MTTVTGGKLSQGAYTPYVTTGTARRHPRCPMQSLKPSLYCSYSPYTLSIPIFTTEFIYYPDCLHLKGLITMQMRQKLTKA